MKRPLLSSLVFFTLFACGGPKDPETPKTETAAPSPNDAASPTQAEAKTASEAAESSPKEAQETAAPRAAEASSSGAASATASSETRTREVIQEIVQQHRGTVRECYKKAAKDHPELAGNLTIAFTIDPKGKVSEATVNEARSDLRIPELDKCAIDTILKLEFPPSSRGRESSVNYPFNFTPGNH